MRLPNIASSQVFDIRLALSEYTKENGLKAMTHPLEPKTEKFLFVTLLPDFDYNLNLYNEMAKIPLSWHTPNFSPEGINETYN